MGLFFTPWDRYLHASFFPLPQVERVCISDAPAYMRGLKALFLSDVHLRRRVSDAKLHALIAMIAAQGADIVLLGGDYAETDDQCARFFEAFGSVSAPLGCFGVIGNNDDRRTLAAYMRSAGVELLLNRSTSLPLSGGTLQIGGCDEHKFGAPYTQRLFSGDGYRILLSHFPAKPDCAAELMLSGHTHGGQLNLLGLTPYSVGLEHSFHLLAVRGQHTLPNAQPRESARPLQPHALADVHPTQPREKTYPLDRRNNENMRLLICNGVGVSRLPLRIGAKAQMLLLEFGK